MKMLFSQKHIPARYLLDNAGSSGRCQTLSSQQPFWVCTCVSSGQSELWSNQIKNSHCASHQSHFFLELYPMSLFSVFVISLFKYLFRFRLLTICSNGAFPGPDSSSLCVTWQRSWGVRVRQTATNKTGISHCCLNTLPPPHPPILTNPPAHPTQKQQSQMQEMLRQLSQQQQRVQSNTETVHMVTSCSARSPPEEGDMSKQTASSW